MRVGVGVVCVLFLVLPRVPVAYPLYLIASMAIIHLEWTNKQAWWMILSLATFFAASFGLNNSLYDVSPTGFLLELALLAPLLLFIAGFKVRVTQDEAVTLIRLLNLVIFLLSLVNLVVNWNFPFQLPYFDFLPDAYAAFYDRGGAKIVTIIGLFGLLIEIYTHQPRNRMALAAMLVAACNFILPSYIMGILCGVAAMGLVSFGMRTSWIVVVGLLLSLLVLEDRWNAVADAWFEDWGMPPKIYAFVLVWDYLSQQPLLLLIGTGLGQFSSEASIWSSELFSEFTKAVELPGFFMSEHHELAFKDASKIWMFDYWALSSSANKPYGTISSLIAEMGLPVSAIIALLFYLRIQALNSSYRRFAKVVLLSSAALMLVDSWADQPWFSFLILLCSPFLKRPGSVAEYVPVAEPAIPPRLATSIPIETSFESPLAQELREIAPVRVDINTATIGKMLKELDGMDRSLAFAIVNYRFVHGFFDEVEDLKKIKSVTDQFLERNRSLLVVSRPLRLDL